MTSGPSQQPGQGARPPSKEVPAGWYRPPRAGDGDEPVPETTWTSTPSWERERPQGATPTQPQPVVDVDEHDSGPQLSLVHRLPVVPIVLTALVCAGFAWVLTTSGYSSQPEVGQVVAGASQSPTPPAADGSPTPLGPMSFALPPAAGPWEQVPSSVLAAPQVLWSGAGTPAISSWKVTTSGGAEVSVTKYAAGAHAGAQSAAQRAGGALSAVRWPGSQPSATVETAGMDGTKSLTVFIDAGDGSMVQAAVRAPVQLFTDLALGDVLTSATLTS